MRPDKPFAMTAYDYLLYAGLIWGWSTSWYAIKLQLGETSPEVSVFWRFLITAPLMFALARWRGETLRMDGAAHRMLAPTGMLMFSSNFILIYYAGERLPSGFLAVVFSLSSIFNFLLGMAFRGEPFRWRLAVGGLMGATGVALLFWPQIAEISGGAATAAGLAFGVCATLSFSVGNQLSAALQQSGVGVMTAAAWGMAYGTLWAGAVSLARGQSFATPLTPSYWLSMAFLVVSATILAFYTFLSLVGRIGPARASYAAVIFPVFALMISTMLEGYRWEVAGVAGLMLAIAGNVLVLRRDPA